MRLGLRFEFAAPRNALIPYVATTLPNVPAERRGAVANAAILAADGQGYPPESVIDELAAASHWWSPDPLACFQDDTGTIPSAINSVVGAWKPWVGLSALTVGATAQKPILKPGYLNFDGVDDTLSCPVFYAGLQFCFVAAFKNDLPYHWALLNGENNGYGFYGDGASDCMLYSNVAILANGPYNNATKLYTASRDSSAAYRINGVGKSVSNANAVPSVPSGKFYFFIFGGRMYDVFFYANGVARLKTERFLNFYRGLNLL